ncbi:MAG: tRNA guanosine(34) transglycosylase Tgt [bacterium]
MPPIEFIVEDKIKGKLGRAGTIKTPHGVIHTPAFVPVATKATVKALTPEQVRSLGAQVVLANTYHLYLQPGDGVVAKAGGFSKFMNWNGPTITDSGGFQVFSLGAKKGERVNKMGDLKTEAPTDTDAEDEEKNKLVKITEDGVTFKSFLDGSSHNFTPERSVLIQHNLGADIFFAFDECASPLAPYEYQREAMERTHRWAERSLTQHKLLGAGVAGPQAIFGIVQGGKFEDLRKESAKVISKMDFDGFGIGGSFNKDDMDTAVGWVNKILPENKPRHLLGIGEPLDLFGAVENGCDTFDCVSPTRSGRNGTIYTNKGKINILNAKYAQDFTPIEEGCECYTCKNYTRAYVSHLFRAKEMLAGTLASIHNLHFLVSLAEHMRLAILKNSFFEFKEKFLKNYNY